MRSWKFNHIDFSTYPFYEGDDLGVFWSPEKTVVKIWAPTAQIIELRLYKDGESTQSFHKTNLQSTGSGIWSTVLKGDYEGKFYTFRINDGENERITLLIEHEPDVSGAYRVILEGIYYGDTTANPTENYYVTSPVEDFRTDYIILNN